MSRYLIQRLTENPKIDLHMNTEITALEGGDHLERVRMAGQEDRRSVEPRHSAHVVMTGASTDTEWLRGCLAMDNKGFILTGRDLDGLSDGFDTLAAGSGSPNGRDQVYRRYLR